MQENLPLSQDLQAGSLGGLGGAAGGILGSAMGIPSHYLRGQAAMIASEVQMRERVAYSAAQAAERELLSRQEELNSLQSQRTGWVTHNMDSYQQIAVCTASFHWQPGGLIPVDDLSMVEPLPGLAPPPIQGGSLAHCKAHALLLEHLGQDVYVEFMRCGWIRFSHGRDWYVFTDGRVVVIDGGKAKKLCIQLAESCPVMDKIVALKLALEDDEQKVLKEANVMEAEDVGEFLAKLVS